MTKEKNQKPKPSPMMEHYRNTKEKYPDAILFYRLGDFYEMFDDDAINVSKWLDLTLTGKLCGEEERAPMCGVPYHSVDTYIAKLLKMNKKIAICEQLTDANDGPVERDVVRIITPGTVTSDIVLDENKNNFILCAFFDESHKKLGIAYADITTGEFFTAEYTEEIEARLNDIISKVQPAEIITNRQTKPMLLNLPITKISDMPEPYLYLEKSFVLDNAVYSLKNHFGVNALSVFEINDNPASCVASGALLDYLFETQKIVLKQIQKIKKLDLSKYMILDSVARRNLEITETMRDRKKNGTLLSVLDNTKTAMGARKLRQWLEQPLKDEIEINARLDGVQELYQNLILRENVSECLKNIKDLDRLTSKIGMKSIMPKECVALRDSLNYLPNLKLLLAGVKSTRLKNLFSNIKDLSKLANLIKMVVDDDPSAQLKEGHYIRKGFNSELDHLRNLETNGTQEINALAVREKTRTGIADLEIKFNRVYGYYIQVKKELSSQVPLDYHRKQTVANHDRYFTTELKELEEAITSANEKANKLENQIFSSLREKMLEFIEPLQTTSAAISELDVLLSFSIIASKFNYVRPNVSSKFDQIKIEGGRHPVVESALTENEFIPNDTFLNSSTDKIIILTGPNMAGKSTFMRQVALITLMAHMGSFVPAKSAEIAITDRIFTRVGASDDLASGQSTFMVEMMEMANILNNATDKSLIILDEIGRGTSTFDGLSIAWAVVDHFSKQKSKVLFATHYHELTELEGLIEGVKNYKINVKEVDNTIIFLRKISRGGANRSFGIEVASLAGVPEPIIEKAREISHSIAQQNFNIRLAETELKNLQHEKQIQNTREKQAINFLKDVNINKISPLEAFEILQEVLEKLK